MRSARWAAMALATALLAPALAAGDEKKAPEMTAEEKAMMEAWMKAATPGEAHKKLEPMVGNWDTKVTMWMKPGAPPEVSTGVSENRWVLDGRWVEHRFQGEFMGRPFHGLGYTGYDNVKKQYVGTWMDTASTSVMMSTGTADGPNTWSFAGTMDDPMTGKTQPFKEKVTVQGPDNHLMEMWGPAPDGTMYKTMEITYTRKK